MTENIKVRQALQCTVHVARIAKIVESDDATKGVQLRLCDVDLSLRGNVLR